MTYAGFASAAGFGVGGWSYSNFLASAVGLKPSSFKLQTTIYNELLTVHPATSQSETVRRMDPDHPSSTSIGISNLDVNSCAACGIRLRVGHPGVLRENAGQLKF